MSDMAGMKLRAKNCNSAMTEKSRQRAPARAARED